MLSAVGVACVGLRLLLAVGVRMARTGFMYVDIYLYTGGVGVDCGAFSCSCGVLCVGWWCVYGMYAISQGLFRVVWWCIYVSMYIMRLWLCWWWCGGGLLVCIWIDIYNGGSLVFYRLICNIQKSNIFHA